MKEPRELVEHFFRHEYGRLVAVLTRSLGVRRRELVEDVVQTAMVQALETWSRRGVPEDPAGWLYRTSLNFANDAFRREQTLAKALQRLAEDSEWDVSPLETHFADEIGDEPLHVSSSSAAMKPCRCWRSRVAFAQLADAAADSARPRSRAACSPPRPTSRSASNGQESGCATWMSNATRRLPPSFALGWTRCSRSSTSCSVKAATPLMPTCRSAATCAMRPADWHGCSPSRVSVTSRRSMPCSR